MAQGIFLAIDPSSIFPDTVQCTNVTIEMKDSGHGEGRQDKTGYNKATKIKARQGVTNQGKARLSEAR